MRAGFPCVHPDQDMGCPVVLAEIGGERTARRIQSGIVKGGRAGDAADAIGSEKFFGHGEKPVQLKCNYRAADFLMDDLGKV